MRTTLRLLFLVPVAFVLATFAAAGAMLWPFLAIPPGALGDPFVLFELGVGFTAQAAQIGSAAFVPFALFALLAEILALRSLLAHLLVGAGAGFLSTRLAPVVPELSVQTASVTAGLAFALVYWILAGRTAGRLRHQPVSTPPQPHPE